MALGAGSRTNGTLTYTVIPPASAERAAGAPGARRDAVAHGWSPAPHGFPRPAERRPRRDRSKAVGATPAEADEDEWHHGNRRG